MATLKNVGLQFALNYASAATLGKIYAQAVIRTGSKTYAASDLVFRLGVIQDEN